MKDIKIIGTGCEKCTNLYENVKKACEELKIEAEISKVEDLVEIVKLGVMAAPSLMVDGKLLINGKVMKYEKVRDLLAKTK